MDAYVGVGRRAQCAKATQRSLGQGSPNRGAMQQSRTAKRARFGSYRAATDPRRPVQDEIRGAKPLVVGVVIR